MEIRFISALSIYKATITTMISIDVRKYQLPDLGENKRYGLTKYDHPLPQSIK